MIDIALLTQQAMAVLGPFLPSAASYTAGRVAEGFLRQPGAKLYDWLTAKFKGSESATVLERAKAEPENQRRKDALQLEIEDLAEKDSQFREELAKLLQDIGAGSEAFKQISDQIGDNNKSAQIIGSGNNVQIC